MKLKETPDLVVFPPTHFLYVERQGPFAQGAPAAWGIVQKNYEALASGPAVLGSLALYQVEPALVYRAGVSLADMPTHIPPDFKYELFAGGDYLRFLLVGPYTDLPQACGRVFEILKQQKIKVPPGAFYGERYLSDIRTTPEAQLETEILVPVITQARKTQ